MRTYGGLLLLLVLAAPGYAQEEAPAETAPETTEALDAVAEEAAAESEILDTVPVNVPEEETEEPTEAVSPWRLYLGLDQVNTTLSVSGLPPTDDSQFDSSLYRLRAGSRLNDNIGLEFHYGIDQDADPGEVTTDSYYGLFLVPGANLFDTLDLTFPVGYAKNSVSGAHLDSVAFGLEAELPLRTLGESLPDVRLTFGWLTYYQKSDARLYGVNFGLRYDFQTSGFSNPFASLDLWPFGDNEDQPVEETSGQ